MTEARLPQSLDMGFPGFGYQHVFEGLAFFRDLQITVTLGALEVVMHVDHEGIHVRFGQGYFLRKDQDVSGLHGLTEPLQQGQALVNRNELERVVEDAHTRVVVVLLGDVALDQRDAIVRKFPVEGCSALGQHGARVVDPDQGTVLGLFVPGHRQQ